MARSGDQLAYFFRCSHVAAGLYLGGQAGGGKDRLSLGVVDDLGVNVIQQTVYVQPWTLGRAFHLLANAKVHPLADYRFSV